LLREELMITLRLMGCNGLDDLGGHSVLTNYADHADYSGHRANGCPVAGHRDDRS
jgi:hypothetical protein